MSQKKERQKNKKSFNILKKLVRIQMQEKMSGQLMRR